MVQHRQWVGMGTVALRRGRNQINVKIWGKSVLKKKGFRNMELNEYAEKVVNQNVYVLQVWGKISMKSVFVIVPTFSELEPSDVSVVTSD